MRLRDQESANTMSPNSPQSPWVYDYQIERYVRWDQKRRCWVDEHGRPGQPPQAAPLTLAPPPPPARIGGTSLATGRGSGRSAISSSSTTSSIEDSLRQMTVGGSKPRPVVAQGYTATALDERTGAETVWAVTDTWQYEDPRTKSTRVLNVKRIKQPDENKRPPRSFRVSEDPVKEYTPGRVIEVALVPPSLNTRTSLSQITPSPGTSQVTQRTRYRRFVIVRQRPQGRNSFEALAIKTYNGLGVSATGVIKSHHTIIHTATPPPQPLPEELPVRRPNGQMEDGMQAMPIRVRQWDRTTALDPKARLDYMEAYEFDFGVTNIRTWGNIHPDSEATFYAQYNLVWAMVMGAAAGPGPGFNFEGGGEGGPGGGGGGGGGGSGGGTGGGRRALPPSDTASTAGTVTVAAYQGRYGSTSHTAGSAKPGGTTSVAPGVISDQAMRDLVKKYQDHARRHKYPVPGQSLTSQQIHGLAQNPEARAIFLQRIKDAWNDSDEDADSDEESGSDSE